MASLALATSLSLPSCREGKQPAVSLLDARPKQEVVDARQAASRFAEALISRNIEALKQFVEYEPAFFGPDGFLPALERFLYVSTVNKRSVADIAAGGPLDMVIVPQSDNVVIVIYLPSVYRDLLDIPDFLETAWMEKYFACQFRFNDGQWTLFQNFCFDETGGPFQYEIG